MRVAPFLERIDVVVYAEPEVAVDFSLGGRFVEAVPGRTEAGDSVLRYVKVEVSGPGTWDLQESDIRVLKEREGSVDGLEIVVVDKEGSRV
ncbi:hypothetical protein BDZ89DRAFT_1066986 [Hymenopellis radicata]|nr:hypothetical protein BDZ89DRAFT_1066986 [Hymenopellis radicata]